MLPQYTAAYWNPYEGSSAMGSATAAVVVKAYSDRADCLKPNIVFSKRDSYQRRGHLTVCKVVFFRLTLPRSTLTQETWDGILDHFGRFWAIFGDLGRFGTVLGDFGYNRVEVVVQMGSGFGRIRQRVGFGRIRTDSMAPNMECGNPARNRPSISRPTRTRGVEARGFATQNEARPELDRLRLIRAERSDQPDLG